MESVGKGIQTAVPWNPEQKVPLDPEEMEVTGGF